MAAAASSSSLLLNPLTSSLCNSKKSSTDRTSETLRLRLLSSVTTAAAPLRLTRQQKKRGKASYSGLSVTCKAVSVTPQTEIEGLNIAEDVTQVISYFLVLFFFFFGSDECLSEILKWVGFVSHNYDSECDNFENFLVIFFCCKILVEFSIGFWMW